MTPARRDRRAAGGRRAADCVDPAGDRRLADRLRAEPVDLVVIAARGTSDHAAIYAQYLLGTGHRLPVALAAPSILSLYGVEPRFAGRSSIGISQSGASPDVVGVVEAAGARAPRRSRSRTTRDRARRGRRARHRPGRRSRARDRRHQDLHDLARWRSLASRPRWRAMSDAVAATGRLPDAIAPGARGRA